MDRVTKAKRKLKARIKGYEEAIKDPRKAKAYTKPGSNSSRQRG